MIEWTRRRLAAKLALSIVIGTLTIDAISIWDLQRIAVEALERRAGSEAEAIARLVRTRLESELAIAERVPARIAAALRQGWIGREALERQLCVALEANSTVFGSAAIIEAGVVARGADAQGPYCYRDGTGTTIKDLAARPYEYARRAWYREPRASGTASWSEPYFDEGGGEVLMVTYSVPIRMTGGEGERVVGVATADVALEWLDSFTRGLRVGETGYAFLVAPGGLLVGYPGVKPGAPLAASGGDAAFAQVVGAAAGGGPRPAVSVTDPRDGRPGWLGSFPLGRTDWRLLVFFPEQDVLMTITAVRRRLLLGSLLSGLALAAVVALVARSTVRPITALARATRRVAGGQLDAPLPPLRSRDEVGRLTESFAEMQRALVRQVEQIRQSAAEQERLDSELRIARQIQMSLVPRPEALSAEHLGCEVAGLLDPARAVGGDLFDVIRRDNGKVCFVIGDVSDKGIPAALLMAVTHTLFTATARRELPPERMLTLINDALTVQDAANMFVTLQCGVLDPASGHLSLATGGHTRAMVVGRDGAARFVHGDLGTVLGVVTGLAFESVEWTLERGDALILYTDGVTEAHDPAGELFGEERLLAHLAEAGARPGAQIAEGIREAVRDFSQGAPQFDDIAILVIRRPTLEHGIESPGEESTLEIGGEIAQIAHATRWLHEWCGVNRVGDEVRRDLDLALDELLSNVIDHGGASGRAPIRLALSLRQDCVRLEIRDRGVPFDPRQAGAPRGAAEDGEGGLGLSLLQTSLDRIDYVREAGENRVLVERRLRR